MALDELHARRLATVGKVLDAALDRMELVLRSAEEDSDGGESSRITAEQARAARDRMATIRSRLQEGLRHFSVQLERPEPKQMLVAELSTLWVILENARPERMKGYGHKFAPQDRVEWENLIRALMHEIEQIRGIVLKGKVKV
jgi:hypothetical protein